MLNPAKFPGEKFEPQLAQEWLKKINALGIEQNKHLVKEWGLTLDDYGYRLS